MAYEAVTAYEADTAVLIDPENDPVKDVADIDPDTLADPETISPFFTINSFAIFSHPFTVQGRRLIINS